MSAQPVTPEPEPEPTAPAPAATSAGAGEQQSPRLASVPEPESTPEPDPVSETAGAVEEILADEEEDGPRTWGEWTLDQFDWAREKGLVPPDVWGQPRPSLSDQWDYARYSEQFPPNGVVRYLAIGYTALSGVYTARDYSKTWIRERPARAAAFAALLTLAALFGPTRWVLTVLLTPAHLLIELVTNY